MSRNIKHKIRLRNLFATNYKVYSIISEGVYNGVKFHVDNKIYGIKVYGTPKRNKG